MALPTDCTIRSYRAGDEEQAAALFNRTIEHTIGSFCITPDAWVKQYRRSWRSPGLDEDSDCVRIAERDGRLIGYCVADYYDTEMAVVQEVCVEEIPEADAIVQALLQDVETLATARGKLLVAIILSLEDGRLTHTAALMQYEFGSTGTVFMTAIINLEQCFRELQSELERRLRESEFRTWRGTLAFRSGTLTADLSIADGVTVARVSDPDITIDIAPDILPLLLFGRRQVGEAYLQDQLVIHAEDKGAVLRLLEALFPRIPIQLPRAQWW